MISGDQSDGIRGDDAVNTESVVVVLFVEGVLCCIVIAVFDCFLAFLLKNIVCLSRTTYLCAPVYGMFFLCVCTRCDDIRNSCNQIMCGVLAVKHNQKLL